LATPRAKGRDCGILIVRPSSAAIALSGIALFAACQDAPRNASGPPRCSVSAAVAPAPARVPDTSPYDRIFRAAGAEFRVPLELLRAISYVETRWQMVEGHEEFPGMGAAHGLMALRGERLREGAARAGLTETLVRSDATANVRAAAALLRGYADALWITEDDASAWAPVVARYSGIGLAAGQQAYVRDVYAVLAGRRSARTSDDALHSTLDPCATPNPPVTDQSGAIWRPSPNFDQRMSGDGGTVHIVIIHSCEGSYAGCWSWLANPSSHVSAHYVVREDGAEITQLVRESSRAWHIAAVYDSTLNAGHEGKLHGTQSNHFTIGVEHAGFASQTSWPAEQIDASARLVCDVAKRWQIPRDRLHVVSHAQLQPYNRTDPGSGWPWADYLTRINRYCEG
jgi:N-acetyl-anhydromuramyl-L-alanine amidase AmpD